MSKWGSTKMDEKIFNRFFMQDEPVTERVDYGYNNFNHFCKKNDFDLCCYPPNFYGPDTVSMILIHKTPFTLTMGWNELNNLYGRTVVTAHSAFFWSRKNKKRCFVSNAFIPDNVDQMKWAEDISKYAEQYGLCVQIFPNRSFYDKDAVLIIFSTQGDILD